MARLPSGFCCCASGCFQSKQKIVAQKRIISARDSVPLRSRNLVEAVEKLGGERMWVRSQGHWRFRCRLSDS